MSKRDTHGHGKTWSPLNGLAVDATMVEMQAVTLCCRVRADR